MKALVPLIAAVALLAGCTTVSVRRVPAIDLTRFHHVFVERPFNENHHLDEYLVDELRHDGFVSESGPMTMLPDDADAVLSYQSRWNWDFTTYLMELDLSLRTAHTNKKLAEARYYQPTIRTRSPARVVHTLITRIFAPRRPAESHAKK